MTTLNGESSDPIVPAIVGKHGGKRTELGGCIGLMALSENGIAIQAVAKKGTAVWGISEFGYGVHASSVNNEAVHASSEEYVAVRAEAKKGTAVWAISEVGYGVHASSVKNVGVYAISDEGEGIHCKGGTYAGYFDGIVFVTGDIELQNADCAEEFDILDFEGIEPGTVMVIDSDETMRQSRQAQDKRVAGVVSGADDLKPGLVLGKRLGKTNRVPIALIGKVYCKADAQYGAIEIGDLLTTSPTPGHAMKVSDHLQAFGAVIGKALKPLKKGQDSIPILISLQQGE